MWQTKLISLYCAVCDNSIITNLCGCINDNAPKLLEVGIELLLELGAGLIEAIPDLIANIPQIIEAIIAVFSAFNWLEFGSKIIKLIGDGFKAMASHLPDLMKQIGTSAKNLFASIDWTGLGSNVITWIANGIKALLTAIPKLLLDIGKNAIAGIKGIDWAGVGQNLIEGIKSGVVSAAGILVNAAVNAAKNAINAVKSWLGIRSPSRRAKKEIGVQILPGIGQGIEESEPELNKKMESAADDMLSSFGNRTHDIDVSGLVARMRAGVEMEAGSISTDVQVRSKIGSSKLENDTREELDYDRLGEAVARGLILADVKIDCDDRELGRLISDLLPL